MPSKRTTRRSVSLKGTTYARIENAIACGAITDVESISGYLERLVHVDLTQRDVPVVETAPPRPERPKKASEVHGGGHFTF